MDAFACKEVLAIVGCPQKRQPPSLRQRLIAGGRSFAAVGGMGRGCRPPSEGCVEHSAGWPPAWGAGTFAAAFFLPDAPPCSGVPGRAGAVHRAWLGVSHALSVQCMMLMHATMQEMAYGTLFLFPRPTRARTPPPVPDAAALPIAHDLVSQAGDLDRRLVASPSSRPSSSSSPCAGR